MEDHHQGNSNQEPNSPSHHGSSERSEPVRSRWTPKPEQILILESIFNSGMVNPPKDETVRIRKLLEKFGSVGDANVFYWFQNRRSRSRRRQRQLQASLAASSEQKNNYHQGSSATAIGGGVGGGSAIPYGQNSNCGAVAMGFSTSNSPCLITSNSSPSNFILGGSSSSSSSSCGVMDGDGIVDGNLYSIPTQMGFQEIEQSSSMTSMLCPSENPNLPYQSGFITVFINGVPTEVPRGLIDMKAVFGQDVVLVHSSGVPLPVNEFGVLMQTLQHGESYFLVSRTA